jgi:hypothetical protein
MIILLYAKDELDCISLADELVKHFDNTCIRISEKYYSELVSAKGKTCNFRFSGLDTAVFLSKTGYIALVSCKALDQFDLIWLNQKTEVYQIYLYNSKEEGKNMKKSMQEVGGYSLQIDTSDKFNLSVSKIIKFIVNNSR